MLSDSFGQRPLRHHHLSVVDPLSPAVVANRQDGMLSGRHLAAPPVVGSVFMQRVCAG